MTIGPKSKCESLRKSDLWEATTVLAQSTPHSATKENIRDAKTADEKF